LFVQGAFTIAGAVAAASEQSYVGVGTTSPLTRSLGALAVEVATLQIVTEGKAMLALAPGPAVKLAQLGLTDYRPRTAIEEAIPLLRTLLSGATANHSGYVGSAVGLKLSSVPDVSIPVLVGATGDRMLQTAARVADGVLLSLLAPPSYLRHALGLLGPFPQMGKERSFRVVAFVPAALGTSTDTKVRIRRRLIRQISRFSKEAALRRLVTFGSFMSDATLDEIAEDDSRGIEPSPRLPEGIEEELAIHGGPRRFRERLEEYKKLGVDEVCLFVDEWDEDAWQVLRAAAGMSAATDN
jgi:alkanesulfonate monooxygenase SsuD/methylene tetrahydromethanopterin reductase-like flavin-dependent oxidoreductase (luciferase family)